MGNPARFYAKQTHRKLGKMYHAVWMPNEIVGIGAVGIMHDRWFFRRKTSLENLGVSFDVLKDTTASPMDLTFESGTSIVFKAEGESNAEIPSVPVAKAGVGIEFSKKGAFVVRAAESYADSIDDIPALEASLRKLVAEGKWSKDWFVVVKATRCPAATVVVSRSTSAKVEFAVAGDISVGGSPLGTTNVELSLTKQTNAVFSFENSRNVAPFIQLARLQRSGVEFLSVSPSTLASGALLEDDGGLGGMSPNDYRDAAGALGLTRIVGPDDPDDDEDE